MPARLWEGFRSTIAKRLYLGSDNDILLNIRVIRVAAQPAAVTAMNTSYRTTGVLRRPLITLHTLRDQQVPYAHELLSLSRRLLPVRCLLGI